MSPLSKPSHSPIHAKGDARNCYFVADTSPSVPLQGLRSSLLFSDFSGEFDSIEKCCDALASGRGFLILDAPDGNNILASG
jgi:hypothetical protein